MDEFRFEHTHHLSEAEHTAIAALRPKDVGRRWINRIGLAILGLVCLFSPYTFLLGIGLLGLGALALVMPRFVPFSATRTYRKLRYLHGPLTYGVSPERLWIRGSDFQGEAAWRHLATWSHHGAWLVLATNGLPMLLLPVVALQEAGLYDQVLSLAKAHAPEFDSTEARLAAL